jgi:nitroimidazol reductase NimA-like FMN-containing flavoprotein (pyridoxamine 5'-phosphate oxidase superfamily)
MQDMTVQEIDQMLSEARIGRLSMADVGGRPYTIPLPFCWTDGSIYLRLPLTGRNGIVLTQNDQVCFEVDHFTETLDEYASVLVEGQLVSVTSTEQKLLVKLCNDQKYNRLRHGHRPGHRRSTPIDELPLRQIIVERLSGRKKDPVPERAELMIAEGI